MRRISASILFFLLVSAFTPQAYAFAPFVSWWDAESADNGFGVGVKQSVYDPSFISIEPRAAWYSLDIPGDNANVFPLEASLLARIAILYGGVGGGFYPADRDLKDKLGWFGLVGVEIKLGKLGIFGEGKYTNLETEFKKSGSRIDLSGPAINVGVRFGGR